MVKSYLSESREWLLANSGVGETAGLWLFKSTRDLV